MTTYHGIKSAVRLCCTEGGVITDNFTLEVMNDAPMGEVCPRCGGVDILWTLEDGSRGITRADDAYADTEFFKVEPVPAP